MENKEILEKAIQKAIDNGCPIAPTHTLTYVGDGVMNIEGEAGTLVLSIFNHDFAKALWGETLGYSFEEGSLEEEMIPDHSDYDAGETWRDEYQQLHYYWVPAWFYHLQRMVVADDPIKYLGENL